MQKLIPGIALLCLAAFANAASAAAATYVYNSPNYTTAATAPYTSAMKITGNFTTALPLAANLSNALIGPGQMNLVVSWSFSDGIQTFTNLNSRPFGTPLGGFKVSTDATGAITSFDIELVGPTGTNTVGQTVNAIALGASQSTFHGVSCTSAPGGLCSAINTGVNGAIGMAGPGGTFTLAPVATTYTYSGSQYTSASAPYTTGIGITGSFTTAAPLAANLANAQIGPGGSNQVIAWSFNDGIQTYTHLNSKLLGGTPNDFIVSTDAKGAITAFNIVLQMPTDVTTAGQKINFIGLTSSAGAANASQGVTCATVNNGACSGLANTPQATGKPVGTFAAPPTTYYYTGTPYTSANAPYSTAMKVSGQIVMPSPLPPNFSGAIGPVGMNLIKATSWSFNDGVQTLTNADSQLWRGDSDWFEVSTDAAGAISDFRIGIYGPTGTTTVGQLVNEIIIAPFDQEVARGVACGQVNNGACTSLVGGSDKIAASTGRGTFSFAPVVSPPTAAVVAATAISATSATLNGVVDDNGAVTSASFDYGTTTSFGANVAATPSSIPAGSGSTAVRAIISGLTCNTTYRFRLRAGSTAGSMVSGSGLAFTTAVCAPLATAAVAAPSLDLRGLLVLVGLLAFAGAARRRLI